MDKNDNYDDDNNDDDSDGKDDNDDGVEGQRCQRRVPTQLTIGLTLLEGRLTLDHDDDHDDHGDDHYHEYDDHFFGRLKN